MNKQKELWERLAKENSKYYINSDFGKGITEGQFIGSGYDDFIKYIATDELLLERLNFPTTHVLEIGCGTGRMTKYMASCFKRVTGLDISGEMIKQAVENLKGTHNVDLIETDGFAFSMIPDNEVHFVFSYIVFQHFKTMEMVESNFKESYRVLKPGGMMKVRVRTDNVEEKMGRWWAGIHCDEQVALDAGFKLIKKEPVEQYGLWLWLEKPLVDKK